ncbi:hypothetical protein COU76_00545 [Candidatus Peregrinibacteria bacterium CG10_big_fil_rev_8_21_14_0_10_49_10]|nr:MAG: hypothetical protein COU76_00545 [Candidatus Peregrinibacteria bacterium CG10_big_fil_rev_8_21_14_0_10_49_10]
MNIPRRIFLTLALVLLICPVRAGSNREPYEQEFLITAYYSPLPGQCCYVKGGYEADKVLNGEGKQASDGTAVYPGMLAAPASYPYGTKVDLPGIGVLTVHDRGGAIQELQSGMHRLDVWVGYGEEGLARALEFGLQHVRGTVYPPGFHQPQTHLALENLPAPLGRLESYKLSYFGLLALRAQKDDQSLSVRMLQEQLKDMGYFRHPITGLYGEVTQQALAHFLQDYHLSEPTDELTAETAAFLLSAAHRKGVANPIQEYVDAESQPETLREAQRILRFLGYYRGRTDGLYTEALADAILRFQQENFLVGTQDDPGAGRIGPLTMQQIRGAWDRKLVAERAEKFMLLHDVVVHIDAANLSVEQFLSEGDNGSQVRRLQSLLAEGGYFPKKMINGNYGPLTADAVLQYQLARNILHSPQEHGAGVVGPATLTLLRKEQSRALYQLVRAEGRQAL